MRAEFMSDDDPEKQTGRDPPATLQSQGELNVDGQPAFAPRVLDGRRFSITDAILPSRRASWREFGDGLSSFNDRNPPASPWGTTTTQSEKRDSRVASPSRPVSPLRSIDSNSRPSDDTLPVPSSPSHVVNRLSREPQIAAPAEPESDLPTGFRLLMILVALNLSIFLVALDNTIVATAIPAITDEFHGLQDVAWYGAVFFMTAGGFQSTWGKIYKYFLLKPSYLTAIFIFELGSLICAVAPSSPSFIVGRAIAGVGAAGAGSGAYTIIAFVAEPKTRATYTGILGAVYGIASVLGPLLGGVFSTTVNWRWCFWINLPIGAVAVGVIIFFLHMPESAKPQAATWLEKFLQIDPIGTTLFMGAIVTYLLAVHYGGQIYPWSTSLVVGLLVGAGLIFLAFSLCEYCQGERAIVVPRLFRRREIFLSALYSTVLPGGFFSMIYYLPIYFQAIRGSSAIISGVQNLPFIVSAMTGALSAGVFISKTGLSKIVVIIGPILGTIGCGLCYTFDTHTPIGNWIGYQIVAGLGFGGSFQVPVIVVQASVDPVDLSTATSMLLSFQTVGGALFISASQSVFVNILIQALPTLAPDVDPMQVVAVGAGQIRQIFPAADLPGIITSYLEGIKVTFILETALAGIAFLTALFFSWKRLDVAAVKEHGGAA